MSLKKFIIERDIPKVGTFDDKQLAGGATKSNEVLCQIGAANIQWVNSFVAADKTFCVYLAVDEAAIRKHSEMSGFPANKITEIVEVIDPTTAS
jgi:Nickel responsive protein SCO4226-like